jgi:hypothetical protein
MYLDERINHDSAELEEHEPTELQKEKMMRQVEEARIATRRIRVSHRRMRNSKSPSRLVGSDHVTAKSIRDPIKPTSNSSNRSERSRSVESLTRVRRDKVNKNAESDILRKAGHASRSERRRARSIDASKHRKIEHRRLRSKSIDEGNLVPANKDAGKPSTKHGRCRSGSVDAEAVQNKTRSHSNDFNRKPARAAHHNHHHHHHHHHSDDKKPSPTSRRRPIKGATKKKFSSKTAPDSPFLTSASNLRRPSGDGSNAAMFATNLWDKQDGFPDPHHAASTAVLGIHHELDIVLQPTIPTASQSTEIQKPKGARDLVSAMEPSSPVGATTATGEATQELKMEEWVSDDSDEEAFLADADTGML